MEAKKRSRTESLPVENVVKRSKSNSSEIDPEPKPSTSTSEENFSRQPAKEEHCSELKSKSVKQTSQGKKLAAKKSKYEAIQLKSKELLDCTRHEIALRAREVKPTVDKSLFRDPKVTDSRFALPFKFYSDFESNTR